MKYNKILSALLGLSFIGAISCTDNWNDHYSLGSLGEGTLWEAISERQDLSNFAKVMEATGYDKSLASSQVFTVFAPTNSTFSEQQADSVIAEYKTQLAEGLKGDKNTAIKTFVMNHIALYNYSVANETPDTTIRVMNGKYLPFTHTSFSGRNFVESNIPTGNGILYTINGQAVYSPSIFEYTTFDEDLDSVENFLYMSNPWQFHVEEFQASESVPGEIVNGKQEYLDSVTVINNSLLKEWLNADLDDEDSSYYAVFPTNKAWKEQYEKNITYFQYSDTVAERDSFMYVFPRVGILQGMQFSKSENPKIDNHSVDSVMSTVAVPYSYREIVYGSYDAKHYQFDKPWANGGIFANTTIKQCSNGTVLKADKWVVNRKNTFIKDIIMEAESSQTLDSLSGATQDSKPDWSSTNVLTSNPFYNKISKHSYNTLTASDTNMPFAVLDFSDVLSNLDYDMYVVTVPAKAADTLATDTLPTFFKVTLYYRNTNGKQDSREVTAADGGDFSTISLPNGRRTTSKSGFKTDPAIVDKIKIGTFRFPTCSYNLDQAEVKIKVEVNLLNSVIGKTYSKTLRIDRIILEPHEKEDE